MLDLLGFVAAHRQIDVGVGAALQDIFFQDILEQRFHLEIIDLQVQTAGGHILGDIQQGLAVGIALIHIQFHRIKVEYAVFGFDLQVDILHIGFADRKLSNSYEAVQNQTAQRCVIGLFLRAGSRGRGRGFFSRGLVAFRGHVAIQVDLIQIQVKFQVG